MGGGCHPKDVFPPRLLDLELFTAAKSCMEPKQDMKKLQNDTQTGQVYTGVCDGKMVLARMRDLEASWHACMCVGSDEKGVSCDIMS